MKKTRKLSKKQLALKKQQQKHYITAALLATAIVLIGVFFYTLKPSSATYTLQLEFPLDQQSQDNEIETRIYPGIVSVNATCLVNGIETEINSTFTQGVSDYYQNGERITQFRATIELTFPYTFEGGSWVVRITFNMSISNITVRVNNMLPNEPNTPIRSIEYIGNTLIIEGNYGDSWNISLTFPYSATRRDEE